MKAFFPAFVTSLCLAQVAVAGGPTAVADDPAPVATSAPAAATDWSGFYGGLSFGRTSGDFDLSFVPTPPVDLDDGTATGLHVGYLRQNGSLVFGGEIALTSFNDTFVTGFTCCEVNNSIDLKGRVGLAMNRALIYGVLGYSLGSYTSGPGDEWNPKGPSFGLGVDVMATERLIVGLEYLSRDLTGDASFTVQETFLDVETLSLRVGLKF